MTGQRPGEADEAQLDQLVRLIERWTGDMHSPGDFVPELRELLAAVRADERARALTEVADYADDQARRYYGNVVSLSDMAVLLRRLIDLPRLAAGDPS